MFKEPTSKPAINEVADPTIRGLLRGLLSRSVRESALHTINKIRRFSNFRDWQIVSDLLLVNPLFSHLPFPAPFPNEPMASSQTYKLDTQSLANELAFQSKRFYLHKEKISTAISHFKLLNELIYKKDYLNAAISLGNIVREFGYSLFVLSKSAYIYSEKSAPEEVKYFIKELLDQYGLKRRDALSLGLIDTMDDNYDFFTLRRNLLDFAASKKLDEISKVLINWQVYPISTSSTELSARLNALGTYSIIDAFNFVCIHHINLRVLETIPSLPNLDGLIPTELEAAWLSISECRVPLHVNGPDDDPDFNDRAFYRRSLGWIENRDVARFRAVADHLYVGSATRPVIPPAIQSLISDYFSNLTGLHDIATPNLSHEINISKFDACTAGVFTRTIAFVHLVTHKPETVEIDTRTLLRVMDRTTDVALLLSSSEIQEKFSSPHKDLIRQYILSSLLADSIGSSTEKHKLRRVFQEVVSKEHNGSIVEFVKDLKDEYPNIVGHIIFQCTEDFLVQLYFLIEESSRVFETRAELLEWYGNEFSVPHFVERARAIRLHQKLQKVRGEIDDTRLYVDPIRFGQWFEDNHLDEISSLLRGNLIQSEEFESFVDFGDFTTQRQPLVRFALVLQSAFQEFCSNKRYGINSYLGRRIRHGTLGGFMGNAMEEIIKEDRFQRLRDNPQIAEIIDYWLANYKRNVDHWAEEVLHLCSKQRPKGAIRTDITEAGKLETTRFAMRFAAEHYQKHGLLSVVTQVIYEFCWRFVEHDLSQIRPMIENAYLSWGRIDQTKMVKCCPEEIADLAVTFCRTLNARSSDVFKTVSRWFTKPLNLSPSAPISILTEAVLEEVKGHFSDFRPTIVKVGIPDVELIGVFYHHMYDFLYAVIHNAARHGNRTGTIETELRLSELGSTHYLLYAAITSEVRQGEDLLDVKRRIESRLAEVNEDAMITEGNSGIAKIVRLQLDVDEIIRTGFDCANGKPKFYIEMKIARA